MTEDTREVHERILSLLEAKDAVSVLDLGCGRGEHLRMLAESAPPDVHLVGVDFRDNVLEEARAAVGDDRRFEFVQHDLPEALPFEGLGLFDGRMDAYTHTSTRYEPGSYGWERSRDMKGLVKRGLVTQPEYDAFIAGLERLAEDRRFFFAITMFSYVGVKAA